MSFLEGIKTNLKFDEVTAKVSDAVAGATHAIGEKSAGVMKSSVGKMAKENFSKLSDQASGLTNYVNQSLDATGLSKYLPHGGGKRQSPIDIVTSEAKFDESLGDGGFTFGYSGRDAQSLQNTGTCLQIDFKPDGSSSLQAVHYTGEQMLRKVQFRWGTEPMNGSEHLIGGVGYAGEIHLIHQNAKYASYEEALKHGDGLAIVAVFLNESHDDNPALAPIINKVDKVLYKDDVLPLERGFDMRALLPDKMEFWTYDGSLTEAPYQEAVRWTIYRASIPISSNQVGEMLAYIGWYTTKSLQLEKLRKLYAVKAEDVESNPAHIAGNVRAVQPINGRAIRSSFRSGGVCE